MQAEKSPQLMRGPLGRFIHQADLLACDTMPELTVQRFERMRDALGQLRDALADFAVPYGTDPQPGSVGESEIRTFSRPESVHTAQSQAWILVEVTSDQLTAFVKTVTEPVETVASYTCVRSLLEGAALACWLLDPAIGVSTRVARSISFRYEGMLQQLRWARVAGEDPTKAESRLADIAALALTLSYKPILDRNGRDAGAGQHMPSVTDIIGATLDEEEHYRVLSAIAHGHHWALQQLSFDRAPHFDTASAVSGARLSGLAKSANVTAFALFTLVSARAFARTVWYQALYLGWDQAKLRELLEEHFDRLGSRDELRFWR